MVSARPATNYILNPRADPTLSMQLWQLLDLSLNLHCGSLESGVLSWLDQGGMLAGRSSMAEESCLCDRCTWAAS